jgi:hypothetical protein
MTPSIVSTTKLSFSCLNTPGKDFTSSSNGVTKKFSFSGPFVPASGYCVAGASISHTLGGPTAKVPVANSADHVRKFSSLGESSSESSGPSPHGLPLRDADVEGTPLQALKVITS